MTDHATTVGTAEAAPVSPGWDSVGWAQAVRWADEYARRAALCPPLPEADLRRHARAFAAERPALSGVEAVAALLLHNAVWAPRVQLVPPSRRLLLLPQCLRDADACPAQRDAAGLLCAQCGRCAIGSLVAEAETQGYVTLVTEGATLVRQLIAGGRIDAVIGVGCLESLEKLFPDMLVHAVPGLAVPLRRAGCVGTTVDAEWVRSLLRMEPIVGTTPRGGLAETVRAWFEPGELATLRGEGALRDVERLALDVLARGGKRWRPYLSVAVHDALRPGAANEERRSVRCLALAVECFHKASLVHDDIEDADTERYGHPTVHVSEGVPVAINVGDFLVGEGYRLLAESVRGLDGATAAAMLAVAAGGHRTLCLGQGDELRLSRVPRRMGVTETLAVLTDKTAPAFDVALRLGALLAGAPEPLCAALARFSRAFGTAFQVQDDLVDFETGGDLRGWRPNIVLALLCESTDAAAVAAVDHALATDAAIDGGALVHAARTCGALDRARQLLGDCRAAVEAELAALPDPRVSAWLRDIVAQALG